MSRALQRAIELSKNILEFPLGNCGPSDDSDKQAAYVYAFRDKVKPFIASLKRIRDPYLQKLINELDMSPELITDAYDLRSNIYGIIDYLEDLAENPVSMSIASDNFIDDGFISELKNIRQSNYDLQKLIKYCEELNDCYQRVNYLACALLIRAIINYVPPIFEARNFSEVVANESRSLKEILKHLDESARKIADLHAHSPISKYEHLPTKNQIEPFKASFEHLIMAIINKLK